MSYIWAPVILCLGMVTGFVILVLNQKRSERKNKK